MSGILKVQLFNLEKSAETLERIVYNDLTALESLPDDQVGKYEPRVLRKLARLDELQEQIDAVVAKLKEAGAYEPVNRTGNIYEYKPPKSLTPEIPVKPRMRLGKSAWNNFAETIGDKQFSVADMCRILDTDLVGGRRKIRHWVKQGYIESLTNRKGAPGIYRRRVDKAA